MNDVPTYLKHV